MLAYRYVPGQSAYQAAGRDPDLLLRLLSWAQSTIWQPVKARNTAQACDKFYRRKTMGRIIMLDPELQDRAWAVFDKIAWAEVTEGCQPVIFHGDFNLGNIICTESSRGWDGFTAIDWREDFAGQDAWGDRSYDLGKLLAGLYVNWDNARRGDFSPWPAGRQHRDKLALWLGGTIPRDVMLIAALSLVNCAPLHKPPLDKILIERATELIEEIRET